MQNALAQGEMPAVDLARVPIGAGAADGMGVAAVPRMQILEARFHPFDRESPAVVVVARVIWDDAADKSPPRIEPAPALDRHPAPGTVLATLRHLVTMTQPRSFERLQALDSRFWSFVPVDAAPPTVTNAA